MADLGKPHIVLDANNHDRYPSKVELRVSLDGKKWSEPVAVAEGHESITKISFEPVKARYLKLIHVGEPRIERWSISQFYVHGQVAESMAE